MDLFNQRVIGYDATKEVFRKILDILNRRSDYEQRGAALPHGLLMVSEPGLGKSLLAATFMEESNRCCAVLLKDSGDESFLASIKEAFFTQKRRHLLCSSWKISIFTRILRLPTGPNGPSCRVPWIA